MSWPLLQREMYDLRGHLSWALLGQVSDCGFGLGIT